MNLKNIAIKAIEEQIFCEFPDGEMVILSLKDGMYYGLDPVGARIWQLIQNQCTIEEIIQAILAEYEVERERFERDLEDLLQDLKVHGLAEFSNGDAM